jgi:hypothetical protein
MSSVKVLITGIVSIVIQFGLAIAGWGGWHAFFAHPALRALAWVTVGLAALAIPSGGGISTGEKEDRSNRWVLAAISVIALIMSYSSAYTDRVGFWTLDGDRLRWMGVVFCAAGGVLRIVPVYVLRNRFSGLVAIQAGHRRSRRAGFTAQSGTPATSDCLSLLSDGCSHFAPSWA